MTSVREISIEYAAAILDAAQEKLARPMTRDEQHSCLAGNTPWDTPTTIDILDAVRSRRGLYVPRGDWS